MLLGADLAAGIPRQHDLDLDTEHTLSEQDVSAGHVHVLIDRVSGVDHQTVHKLHGLGPLSPQLAGHDNLASLGARLHDETEHTIAGPPDGETSDELVTERLSLGDGAETAGGDLLGVKLDGALGKLNLFWTTLVSSLILLPFSPRTFWVLVAMMMISVLVGVTLTSTPE